MIKTTMRQLALLFIVVLACTACSPIPMAAKEQGIIAWNYKPAVETERRPAKSTPKLTINDLQTAPPSIDAKVGNNALKLLPILSLAAKPDIFHNSLFGLPNQGVNQWEVEKLLADELKKSGLFSKVTTSDSNKGYRLKGSVNFESRWHFHSSGLGSLLYAFSLIGVLALPDSTWEIICNAHFDLLDSNNRTVLSKDYQGRSKYLTGALYGNNARFQTAYGAEVLPQVVKQLVTDMQALPIAMNK